MNNPAETRINGAAQRLSRRYSPGEIKDQTWYSTHGEARKIATRMGSLNQMTVNPSMGVIVTSSGGFTLRDLRASTAGLSTKSHRGLLKERLTIAATTIPASALRMRERSSSRCSMNDMRSMPSSSSSPSSPGGGGGAGGTIDPPSLVRTFSNALLA